MNKPLILTALLSILASPFAGGQNLEGVLIPYQADSGIVRWNADSREISSLWDWDILYERQLPPGLSLHGKDSLAYLVTVPQKPKPDLDQQSVIITLSEPIGYPTALSAPLTLHEENLDILHGGNSLTYLVEIPQEPKPNFDQQSLIIKLPEPIDDPSVLSAPLTLYEENLDVSSLRRDRDDPILAFPWEIDPNWPNPTWGSYYGANY